VSEYSEDAATEEVRGQVAELADAVVGHKIVSAERTQVKSWWGGTYETLVITLDSGKQVHLNDTSDCCAYGEVAAFLLDPSNIDHIITSVTANDDCSTWYVLADMHQVLSLDVAWSEGNYPYYSFGLNIDVIEPPQAYDEEIEAA
jgi:hypothetical protein